MPRIVAAIALMIGFYALALGSAAALLAFWRTSFWLGFTALVILWSIVPRYQRFRPPGPRLEESEQPELFAIVRDVARATGEEMPRDVYLLGDVNAFVSHVGLRDRRILGVGLPLLQTLTVAQLRAVLAHEFGHYAAGDLKLGGWIYRTRAAMERTIENLSRANGIVQRPFLAYGKFFMRVTQRIGRQQELEADQMAVRIAGAGHHAEALRATHAAGQAFPAYWFSEVLPLLQSGYRPPLAEGFAQFLRAGAVVAKLEDERVSEEYDPHPSLQERLAAIGDVDAASDDGPRAITLLRDLPRLERELLGVEELKPVEWADAPAQVFLPRWRERAEELATVIAGATVADVPGRLDVLMGDPLPERQAAVASVVAAKLVDDGWTFATSPGEQIVFSKDGRTFLPFVEATRGAEAWASAARAAGIEAMALG